MYPYPSDLKAMVSIEYEKEHPQSIELKLIPALSIIEEEEIKDVIDIIKNYPFKWIGKKEPKEDIFVIPTEE